MNARLKPKPVQAQAHDHGPASLPKYKEVLLAVDSSDHSNRSLLDAMQVASLYDADITGAHVYAAKLHDVRFRQMEGGLPEQFREEDELERQRDVHDDLITRGLSIITDSYLDHSERQCQEAGLHFTRCSLEGKNYRELARETNSGQYDLLVMGALGLGAVQGSRVGTVCQRVVRRSDIDTLVIKEPNRSIAEGPIVVAIDGSTKAYGGLLTAFSLAQQWQVPVKVIAAFDPYFHYVAFNRIADVLSEEAGKVFRFQEQEKLHEEIIDSGLAKIYQGHLDVAQSIADEYAVEIETKLLDGKPHDAIEKYLKKVNPSLLVIGKLGIHADAELDIGGTSENLLYNTDCALLFSQREFKPRIDMVAETTTSWTTQAEEHMANVPEFVRSMARMAILRYAQEKGHTVITERIVEDATAQLCPGHAREAMTEIVAAYDAKQLSDKDNKLEPMRWSSLATALLLEVDDLSVRGNLMMRAEKKARQEGSTEVEVAHVTPFIDADQSKPTQETEPTELHWQAAALARLARVPEGFMRDSSRQRIEDYARTQGISDISLAIAEAGLAEARKAMESSMQEGQMPGAIPTSTESTQNKGSCPFAQPGAAKDSDTNVDTTSIETTGSPAWSDEAEALMQTLPEGMSREMTRKAIATIAGKNGLTEIDKGFVEQIMKVFKSGSTKVSENMPWDDDARAGISRAPDMVRGMLVAEIEGWCKRNDLAQVTLTAVETVKGKWASRGVFHLDPNDPRNDS